MKKNIILIVFIANIIFLSAQQLDLGLSFVPNASTTNFDMKNMVVTTGLLAHLNYSTKKSYHVIAYNFNATAITSFHGWLYTNDQDLYVVLSKNLKDTDGYLGLGWEFTISNGGFSPSAFVEIGTNYHFAESNFSIGIFAPLNKTIWKKKKSG